MPYLHTFKPSHSAALGAAVTLLAAAGAFADDVTFSTGSTDGKMAVASRPPSNGLIEIEAGDDFPLAVSTALTSATFTGLVPAGASVDQVVVEIYRVFPKDSVNPPANPNHVPTRANSPSDVAFDSRDSADGGLSFSTLILSNAFTALNSVLNGINAAPGNTTQGEGPVTGQEVQFSIHFNSPIDLPPDDYFFVPQVKLSTGNFFWLSAPKPIAAPGTPFASDRQAWIRNENLAPDWLRIGKDIVGGNPAPAFNMTFSLTGVGVSLDVRPGECPNSLNLRSRGKLAVSLIGSAVNDLHNIDISTIRLCRADGVGGCVSPIEGPPGPHTEFEDVGSPAGTSQCDCPTSSPDGIQDLLMHFSVQQLIDALQLTGLSDGAQVELRITASLTDGAPFVSGTDCVVIATR